MLKATPHRIFLKRAIFEKIILFNLLVQIYTKITKKYHFLNFSQRTSLFAKRNFSGLGKPVRESSSPAYLRSLKILPNDFSSQKKKPVQPYFRSFRLLV